MYGCLHVCLCVGPALEEGEYLFCSMYTCVKNCKIRTNVNNVGPLYNHTCVPGGVKINFCKISIELSIKQLEKCEYDMNSHCSSPEY